MKHDTYITGYKLVRHFSFPAETVRQMSLLRLFASCRDYTLREMASFRGGPRDSVPCLTRTVSAGSHLSWTVISAGSKKSQSVSGGAKTDGQSGQEPKTGRLVYTL